MLWLENIKISQLNVSEKQYPCANSHGLQERAIEEKIAVARNSRRKASWEV